MGIVFWRANAARRYPQISSYDRNTLEPSSVGSPPIPAQTGRLHRQISVTQPVYYWDSRRSLLGRNKQWGGTLNPVESVTGTGIREHYDVGNETAILLLVPALAATVTVGSKLTSPALRLLPVMAGSAVISRPATAAFVLLPVMDASAHTETGGNKSGSGVLNAAHAITAAGTLQHPVSGIIMRSVPVLSASSTIQKTAIGNLVQSTILLGNSRVTERGQLTLEPTLRGEGSVRVQSGLWVIIPEDTRKWTTVQ